VEDGHHVAKELQELEATSGKEIFKRKIIFQLS
jgi:hypothetical protein